MKVVVDTNVVASGLFFGGTPLLVLECWKSRHAQLVVSPAIMREYARVLHKLSLKHGGQIDVPEFLDLVAAEAEVVDASGIVAAVCRDADDDKFIAAAIAGKADYIVSGDAHLLDVSGYAGVQVVTPRQFCEQVHGPK